MRVLDEDKSSDISDIENQYKERLKVLEDNKKQELITTEEYENAKKQIEDEVRREKDAKEEEYRKKKLYHEKQLAGAEIYITRQKELEKLNIQKDTYKNELDTLNKKENLTNDELKQKSKLEESLKDIEKTIADKSSSLTLMGEQLQSTLTDTFTNLFAGDTDSMKDNWREYFAVVSGIIQKEISAWVLKMLLSDSVTAWLKALPFPLSVISIPVIKVTIESAIRAITDPILSSLTSFASGGRIEEPTMAIIGDGARLGMPNREWIFNDPQLKTTIEMAVTQNNKELINNIQQLSNILQKQEIKAVIKGSDLYLIQKRASYNINQRTI
jgi:hypothetical protein